MRSVSTGRANRRGTGVRPVPGSTRTEPELEWSARKLGAVTEWAADETLPAIEGFFEGWFSSPAQLPSVSPADADRIVRFRTYRDKRELLKKV